MQILNRYTKAVLLEVPGDSLSGADLSGANLYGADLSRADLYGANLYGASLYGATGDMTHVKSGQLHRWPFVYSDTHLWIGCQKRTFEQWWSATDDDIEAVDSDGLADWKVWKPILQQIIALSPAKPTGYVAPPDTPC